MPAPLPQTPEERARQLSFLQSMLTGEDPGILRKMVAGLTGLPHRASQGEFIEPGRDTLLYASQFAVPGAPESALGTGGGRPFYSKLGEAVETMQPKATGPQLMATLRNQGVKPEELQYSGFEKQFGAAPQVTKGEAQTFLADNGVRVGEVLKGGNPVIPVGDNGRPLPKLAYDDTKFSQYQLPGGQNYKELLLTLPNKRTPEENVKALAELGAARDEAGYNQLRQQIMNDRGPEFQSSHFDEPNVLAHIRMNDRVDANGKKTLFLEEIQSDWHQKGRKQGYEAKPKVEIKEDTYEGKPVYAVYVNGERKLSYSTRAQAEAYAPDQTPGVVPDAPFKKDWHELALKRAIKYAADNGYDSVSWTPGKVQAERYDLSKQVDAISWHSETGDLQAMDKSGKVIDLPKTPKEKLADVIGKEAADKIQSQPENIQGFRHLAGQDLKVGGEGMNAFYDKMLPTAANKIGKTYGAKVGVTKIEGPDISGADTTRRLVEGANYRQGTVGHEVWTLPITDAMRAEVGKKGMPLFTGGMPLPQNQHQDRARMLQNLPAIMGNRS